MDIENFTEIASTDTLTKYEHPSEEVTAYKMDGYENDPVLYIRSLQSTGWMAVLYTNGSFTQMKASQQDFNRALNDGKRLVRAFAQNE